MERSILYTLPSVLVTPQKVFSDVSSSLTDGHVITISTLFGGLFALHMMSWESFDFFFFLTMVGAAGPGFTYFSAYVVAWLIKVSNIVVAPRHIRTVLVYGMMPYLLALSIDLIAHFQPVTGLPGINLTGIIWTWGLNVYGIKRVAGLPLVQALFVMVIPITLLLVIVAVLFKVVWTIMGV